MFDKINMEIKTKQMGMYTACSELVQKSYKQTFELLSLRIIVYVQRFHCFILKTVTLKLRKSN